MPATTSLLGRYQHSSARIRHPSHCLSSVQTNSAEAFPLGLVLVPC
uniref:Uncharacterized protein n=1 Tax=Arundo donax TaxID=35708 RepID=A0A0A8YLF4_ARUDO